MNCEELLKEYDAVIRKAAGYHYYKGKWRSSILELDDLIQAGRIALVKASRRYDPEQGASFNTYFRLVLAGALQDEIRTFQRESRHGAYAIHVPFDQEVHAMTSEDTAEDLALREEVTVAISLLSLRDRQMLEQRLLGTPLKEMGEERGITESHACWIIKRAVKKITKAIGGH